MKLSKFEDLKKHIFINLITTIFGGPHIHGESFPTNLLDGTHVGQHPMSMVVVWTCDHLLGGRVAMDWVDSIDPIILSLSPNLVLFIKLVWVNPFIKWVKILNPKSLIFYLVGFRSSCLNGSRIASSGLISVKLIDIST